jgi:signal transduction histidine kinase
LDVDAIETGGHNVKIESVAIDDVLAQIALQFADRAREKGIQLDIEQDVVVNVLADRVYLRQVLENLVSNALKFSQKDTTIQVSLAQAADKVTIVVADEGPGFTPEDQMRIFKKYQQLSAVSTAGEPSTGLGLSIVKMFTELMNGTVTFQTESGRGTSFFVTLPKAK